MLAERSLVVEEEARRLTAEKLEGSFGTEYAFELLRRGPELYLQHSDTIRVALVKAVASNCIVTAGKVDVNYRKPFDKVAECVSSRRYLSLVDVLRTFRADLSGDLIAIGSLVEIAA